MVGIVILTLAMSDSKVHRIDCSHPCMLYEAHFCVFFSKVTPQLFYILLITSDDNVQSNYALGRVFHLHVGSTFLHSLVLLAYTLPVSLLICL